MKTPSRLGGGSIRRLLYGAVVAAAVGQGTAVAKDVPAASVAQVDVQAAINAAVSGDRVIVPAGVANWATHVEIDKAITVQGAGIGQTIIENNQVGVGSLGSEEAITFILKPKPTNPSGHRLRLTGFEIRMRRNAQGVVSWGAVFSEVRIDNCLFKESSGRAIRMGSLNRALIHDCTFIDNNKTIDSHPIGQRTWSWQNPLTLGTIDCVVIEDCVFRYETWKPRSATAVASHGFGGRAAWRHNSIVNENPGQDFFPCIDAHGNHRPVADDNTGDHRGTRSLEFYENVIVSDVGGGSTLAPTQIRGGTFICFNNVYEGSDVSGRFEMREEDGNDDGGHFNHIDPDEYPGYDQHWVWIWNNRANGNLMTAKSRDGTTATFVVEGTNLFHRAPQAGDPRVVPGRQGSVPSDAVYPYQPLAYPHPWRTGGAGPTGAPSNASANALSSTSVEVTWQDNSAEESQFKIERSLTPGGGFARVGTALGNAESFTDVGLSPSTTYYYRVRASNASGDSASSNEASATTDEPTGEQPIPLMPALTFEAEAGLITPPFVLSNGVVSQSIETPNPAAGGLIRYRFNISEAGNYAVQMVVGAAHTGANSIFVNIGGEPTSPDMIWHLDVGTSGLVEQTVTWVATEGRPKLFPLAAGEHTLYVRGREADVEIDKITVKLTLPAPTGLGPDDP